MATMRAYPIGPGASIQTIAQAVEQNFMGQGFQVNSQIMSPANAMITIGKDRDGFKNIIGLGLECRVSLMINGNQLSVSIDSEWTNKIIAIVVGWFLCLVPFITGIIGAINQSSLPEKIFTAIQIALSAGNPGAGYQANQYAQQQYAQPQPQQYAQPQPQQYNEPQNTDNPQA